MAVPPHVPELPHVEGFRRRFARLAEGRVVARADVLAKGRQLLAPAHAIERALEGRRLGRPTRHGKWMFVPARGGPFLALHFGMTGDVEGFEDGPPPHARLALRLRGGGGVAFTDPRRFGRVALADSPEAFVEERGLGPDAARLGRAAFVDRVGARRGGLKAALMDQTVLAGLGNLWVDEVLFRARLHPRTDVQSLDRRALGRLHAAMDHVLRVSLRKPGDWRALPADWLMKHRGKGARCPRCRAPLATGTVAGRTTYWCPKEQRR